MSNSLISFIIPAKNTAKYISEAIRSILDSKYINLEIILIDDHSQDNTFDIATKASLADNRLKVYKNNFIGKVAGLNYGYSLSKGDIIKCVDSDDILPNEFFNFIDYHNDFDAICHNGKVVDETGKLLAKYAIDPYIINKSFHDCLKYLKSLPRWCWSFNRKIADKIFPMPLSLPFEDIWFSLIIKKYSNNIKHLNMELYDYRQHDNQIYGGILNTNTKTMRYRAERILKVIEVLNSGAFERLELKSDDLIILDSITRFYQLLLKENTGYCDILKADMPMNLKIKSLIYMKMPVLGSAALRTKWFFDKIKSK